MNDYRKYQEKLAADLRACPASREVIEETGDPAYHETIARRVETLPRHKVEDIRLFADLLGLDPETDAIRRFNGWPTRKQAPPVEPDLYSQKALEELAWRKKYGVKQ